MNKTTTKSSMLTAILLAFLLFFLVGAIAAFSAVDAVYAESGKANASLYTPRFSAMLNEDRASYTLTGFDTADESWTNMTAEQKSNIAIVIPNTFTGADGTYPVTAIGDSAFVPIPQ